ncbi:hypothetical protein LCGC14_3127280, partial [marine sediment metagenome]
NKPSIDFERRQAIASALDKLSDEKNLSIVFFSAQGNFDGNDYDEAERTIQLMKNGDKCLNIPYLQPGEFISLLKKLDIVVAMKLHSLILAYSLRIQVIGLSYHQKIESFFEATKLQENCFRADMFSTTELVNKIQSLLDKPHPLTEHSALLEAADNNFTILTRYIEKIGCVKE